MAEMVYIKVSDKVRVDVESEAIQLCKERGLKNEQLNQDLCAVVCIRALKGLGVEIPADKKVAALEVAKVCANASALRQKISSEKVVAAIDEDKIKELQSLIN